MYLPDNEYPLTVDDLLEPAMKFRIGTLLAMNTFGAQHPWSGTHDTRVAKFQDVIQDLSSVYAVRTPLVDASQTSKGVPSDQSYYLPLTHTIHLVGRLSVITLLHEFAHALGKNEIGACRWSLCLFKRTFPVRWDRLRFDGHVARYLPGD